MDFFENGYHDPRLIEWLARVFDPQTKGVANGNPRVLICDGFGIHEILKILEFCFANDIILCPLPSHTSHKLHPCYLAAFAPIKTSYRDEVERLIRGGVDNIERQHFTYLCQPARGRALKRRNILTRWSAAGLFPFNPEGCFVVCRSSPRYLIQR
jgi:hypothetical protein